MADILIRGLDDDVVRKLKARAKSNGRSLQAEVKGILERSAVVLDMAAARQLVDGIRKSFGNKVFSDSTEMVREDRDR